MPSQQTWAQIITSASLLSLVLCSAVPDDPEEERFSAEVRWRLRRGETAMLLFKSLSLHIEMNHPAFNSLTAELQITAGARLTFVLFPDNNSAGVTDIRQQGND